MVNLQRCNQLARRGRLLSMSARARAVADGHETPPPAPAEWFRVSLDADDDAATILVYGDIGGWWGVDAESLVAEIHRLKVAKINAHINSYGGSMFDGFAIYSTLLNHPAAVTTYVDGVAASAASVIAMAGRCVMEKPARLMIHDAGNWASGNAADLREAAQLLDEFSDSVADIYADKAGGKAADFRAAMLAETWYSATAALEVGLCDQVGTGETERTAPENRTPRSIRARARASALGGVSTK